MIKKIIKELYTPKRAEQLMRFWETMSWEDLPKMPWPPKEESEVKKDV